MPKSMAQQILASMERIKASVNPLSRELLLDYFRSLSSHYRIGLRVLFAAAFVYTFSWSAAWPVISGDSPQIMPSMIILVGGALVYYWTSRPNFYRYLDLVASFAFIVFLSNALINALLIPGKKQFDSLLGNADLILLLHAFVAGRFIQRKLVLILSASAIILVRIKVLEVPLDVELFRTGAYAAFAFLAGTFLHLYNHRSFYYLRRFEIERDAAKTKARNISRTSQMLAHDLQAPFGMIDMVLGVLKNNDDPTKTTALMAKLGPELNRSTDLARKLVKDLIEVGNEEPIHGVAVDSTVLLKECLQSALALLNPVAKIDIKISCELSRAVKGDDHKLRRVFQNLLQNAIEAMPLEGGTLIVSSYQIHDVARFDIENSSTTLSKDVAERLFEPFFTVGKVNGTGLGLAICKSLVERHGGTIQCIPKDHTTLFSLELPLAESGKGTIFIADFCCGMTPDPVRSPA